LKRLDWGEKTALFCLVMKGNPCINIYHQSPTSLKFKRFQLGNNIAYKAETFNTPGGKSMLATRNGIKAKLMGIAVRKYENVIRNIQAKRIKKDRTELQAALMLGGIRRVK
jgi:hypothetical protein